MLLSRPSARTRVGALTAGLASVALVALSAAPGSAATVAQASGTALRVTIANTATDSGSYRAVREGDGETTTGNNKPALQVLGNQNFITAGTLSQDAATAVDNKGRGSSAACAGLAGDGSVALAVEDGGGCLTPGDNLSLNAGTFDISNLQIVGGDALPTQLTDALAAINVGLAPVTTAVNTAVQQVLDASGGALTLDLGAIQSQCLATPSDITGDTQITDASLNASIGGQNVRLVEFPVNPDVNQKVVTDLDGVVDAVTAGLRTQLTTGLGGLAAPIAALITDDIIGTINDNLVAQISDQLGPVEDNLLDGTLNKQVRGDNSIVVTALDLAVLPAAEAFGFDLLDLQIGESSCGPNGRRVAPSDPAPSTTPANPSSNPVVPTAIPAGQESAAAPRTDSGDLNGVLAASALGGLAVVSGGVGLATYRRRMTR